ncbi:MAG: YtoQ family protein [Solirubrobacterales bacterium]
MSATDEAPLVGSFVPASSPPPRWTVYLAGEIHSDWRQEIQQGVAGLALPVTFTGPVTDHGASDDCGVAILGDENEKFWADHKGAGVNAIRTQTLLGAADIVVVKFGDQYRQWNAAFDAGQAAATGTPLITLHGPDLDHALKEVDRAALATAREPGQVVGILRYVLTGRLGDAP